MAFQFLAVGVLPRIAGLVTVAVVVKLALALGVGFVVYEGLQIGMDAIETQFWDLWGDVGMLIPQASAIASRMGLVDAVTMAFSAYAGVISIKAVDGVFRSVRLNPLGQ